MWLLGLALLQTLVVSTTSAVSGGLFRGEVIRQLTLSVGDMPSVQATSNADSKLFCDTAFVVTTISDSIPEGVKRAQDIVNNSQCIIVAGDRKGPREPYQSTVFVGIDDQNAMFPVFGVFLPENHFGRKNLGYLPFP